MKLKGRRGLGSVESTCHQRGSCAHLGSLQACKQALRGTPAAELEKEGELATTSL